MPKLTPTKLSIHSISFFQKLYFLWSAVYLLALNPGVAGTHLATRENNPPPQFLHYHSL